MSARCLAKKVKVKCGLREGMWLRDCIVREDRIDLTYRILYGSFPMEYDSTKAWSIPSLVISVSLALVLLPVLTQVYPVDEVPKA